MDTGPYDAPSATPHIPASYLLETGPATAEAQAGAGVDPDHHLPSLLGPGCVVEPPSHGVAPVSTGDEGGSLD